MSSAVFVLFSLGLFIKKKGKKSLSKRFEKFLHRLRLFTTAPRSVTIGERKKGKIISEN